MKMRSGLACLVAAVATVSISSAAKAANLIWDPNLAGAAGSDGSGTWDLSTANWFDPALATDVAWSNGNNALFGNLTTAGVGNAAANNVTLASPITVNNLTLGTAANGASYSIDDFSGGSLTLTGDLIKASSDGIPQIFLFNGLTLSSGNHNFVVRDTPGDVVEMTINGVVSGSGGVVINNGLNNTVNDAYGTTAFNFANTYTGTTTITKGRLVITDPGSLGATSAGTTVGALGSLSIGGGGVNPPANSAITITEPLTITRNTYTGDGVGNVGKGEAGQNPYAVATGNGSGSTTFSGPITIDSTDARFAAYTSTLTITSNLIKGANTATPGISVTGDFAGFVHLTGNNTAMTGGVSIINAVQLEVDNDSEIGGASAPLNFIGGGTYHPINGYATSFGTHVLNNATFNGGIYVDAGKTFTINQALGRTPGDDTNRVGSLGKRGDGTLNINSAVNLRGGQTFWDSGVVNVNSSVELASLHLRSPVVNIGTGGSVTEVAGFTSFGSDSTGTNGGPDKATVNITGTGSFVQTNNEDFNVSDNPNTEGTINLSGNGVLTTNGVTMLGKQIGAKGTINQSGGTLTAARNGNFAFIVGRDNGTGVYNLSGGTFSSPGEVYVGQGFGDGTSGSGKWNQSGGTATISNWFVIGREGGKGDVDISGGTLIKNGGGNTPIGEGGNGTRTNSFTVRGTGTADFQTGEVWVSNGNTAVTMNIQDAGTLNVNDWFVIGRFGNSNGTLNLSGGSMNHAGNNPFIVGAGGGSTGLVTQTGGVYTDTSSNASGGTWISDGGAATYNMSGGRMTTKLLDVGHNGDGAGTLTVSGTAVINADHVRIGEAGTVKGTFNLNGGSVTSNLIEARNSTGTKAFNFNGGTLSAGSFNVGSGLTNTGTGKLAPGGVGATGTTAITGTYTQGATASTAIELSSAGDDSITTTGAATLAGTLNLGVLAGYSPVLLATHNALTASSVSGTFSTIAGLAIAPNKYLAVTYTPTAVNIQAARPGDATLNGSVDFDDLLALAKNYGSTTGSTWVKGDFDGNSTTDFNDLLLLAKFYGTTGAANLASLPAAFQSDFALAQSLAVPEPASITLLGIGAAAALRRNRRR